MMGQLLKEHEGLIKVFKIDLGENSNLAKRLNIRSIPSVMIYKDGNCIETIVGIVPYEKFNTVITELI
ncbi:MAG: thioredoxin family protein [Rivularia sp. ALOHA_DT_140]|nr:thioredoxin family protein [Rivularia sp. ALOHA_DT_140]